MDPFCVVKWRGLEVGRTPSCRETLEPSWKQERFRLAVPDYQNKKTASLVVEVWAEDTGGAEGDFLGQVNQG